jgi:alpha-L-fucosidase
MPTSSEDPKLAQMYGNIPAEKFYQNWYGELKELIDNYSPDLIYFDSKMSKIPEKTKQEFVAYYFNHSVKEGKQVVITHKEGELPKSVSVEDFEKGRQNAITKEFWLTDETVSVGSWSYTNDLGLKSANDIVDLLADIVSKNGALMLNVSPMANGIIPQNQQEILLEIGKWLDVNGEAIYATRPFTVFGEGPTKQEKAGMFLDKITYGAQDIRYTRKGNTVYAIVLGWPGENVAITLSALGTADKKAPKVKRVSILGSNENTVFTQDAIGVHLKTPSKKIDEKAFVIKLELK